MKSSINRASIPGQRQKERSGDGNAAGGSTVPPTCKDWTHLRLPDATFMVDFPDFNSASMAPCFGDLMVDLSTEDIHEGAVPTASVPSTHDACFSTTTPNSFSVSHLPLKVSRRRLVRGDKIESHVEPGR